ncbi:MAG TPA: hypothetical protein VK736_05715 [Candidatus Binatia bacterium]|nr:hypothetical protein [Candidatus Binatia bacterium]
MKQHHPMLWGAGWAGLAVGVALAAMGIVGSNDLLQLAGGYGVMMAGSALYLLVGLKLRETLAHRTRPARIPAARHAVSQTLTQR